MASTEDSTVEGELARNASQYRRLFCFSSSRRTDGTRWRKHFHRLNLDIVEQKTGSANRHFVRCALSQVLALRVELSRVKRPRFECSSRASSGAFVVAGLCGATVIEKKVRAQKRWRFVKQGGTDPHLDALCLLSGRQTALALSLCGTTSPLVYTPPVWRKQVFMRQTQVWPISDVECLLRRAAPRVRDSTQQASPS